MTSPVDPRTEGPEWVDGWWQAARHCHSPNHGPRPPGVDVDLIVLHSISLPPGAYGGPEVELLFTNQLDWDAHPYFQSIRGIEVSAHFFVRRDGDIVQFVSIDRRAWHAGVSRWGSRENCNDFSVGIELEGLEGEVFETAQYVALADLCAAIGRTRTIRAVVGHEHVAPGRKCDPGPGFEWVLLQQKLRWTDACFPQGLGTDTRSA